jgi:hypothetical protein
VDIPWLVTGLNFSYKLQFDENVIILNLDKWAKCKFIHFKRLFNYFSLQNNDTLLQEF